MLGKLELHVDDCINIILDMSKQVFGKNILLLSWVLASKTSALERFLKTTLVSYHSHPDEQLIERTRENNCKV